MAVFKLEIPLADDWEIPARQIAQIMREAANLIETKNPLQDGDYRDRLYDTVKCSWVTTGPGEQ